MKKKNKNKKLIHIQIVPASWGSVVMAMVVAMAMGWPILGD
jgi:hypothetical protein